MKVKEDMKDAMTCGSTWLVWSTVMFILVWMRYSLEEGLIFAFFNPLSLILTYAAISFAVRNTGEEVYVPMKEILQEVKKWALTCAGVAVFVGVIVLWTSLIDKRFTEISIPWTAILVFVPGSIIYFVKAKK